MNYYENKEIADTKPNSIKGKIQVKQTKKQMIQIELDALITFDFQIPI